MSGLLHVLILALCVEAVVEVVQSDAFDWLRNWLHRGIEEDNEEPFLLKLAQCAFCQSFWASMILSFGFGLKVGLGDWLFWLETPVLALVVFRLSHVVHGSINTMLGLGRICMEKVFIVVRGEED